MANTSIHTAASQSERRPPRTKKQASADIARGTTVDEPRLVANHQAHEEEIRTPISRGPVFWWTMGLMLLAVLVGLLWLGNLLAIY